MKKPIPILLYHSVSDHPAPETAPFAVPPKTFASHMDALKARSLRCLTVTEFVNRLPDPGNDIALVTFDDGYLDFAENAVPVMAEREIASTVYVTTGFVAGDVPRPSDPMMQWSQLADLGSADVEVGAHSHSHFQMDTLTTDLLRKELNKPKELLEAAIGKPVTSFAYPHGYNGSRVRRHTRQAGYTSGAGVRNAFSHANDDHFNLARLTVMNDTPVSTIEAWLDGRSAQVATSHEALKTKGWRTYRRAKALATRTPGSDYS